MNVGALLNYFPLELLAAGVKQGGFKHAMAFNLTATDNITPQMDETNIRGGFPLFAI